MSASDPQSGSDGEPGKARSPSRFACLVGPALLGGAVVWTILSYLPVLSVWPLTNDGVFWIGGFTTDAGWLSRTFTEQHGSGYRPVVALSFVANYALTGFTPWIYRLTDLILHALGGVLVYALFRRLAPSLPAWGAALAAALFLAHPLARWVVPIIDTRSYLLANVFSLMALIALLEALGPEHSRPRRLSWAVLAALLMALALLSNQIVLATLGFVPVLVLWRVWPERKRWRLAIEGALPILLAAAAVLLVRLIIVEGGGYIERRFSGWFLPILASTGLRITNVRLPTLLNPDPTAGWVWIGLTAAWMYHLVFGVIAEIRGRRLLPPLLLVWLSGYLVSFGLLGVFFNRMGYPVAVSLSLYIAIIFTQTLQTPGRRPAVLVLHLLPQFFLMGWLLHDSPAVIGLSDRKLRQKQALSELVEDMRRQLGNLPGPAFVRLVLPYRPLPAARQNQPRAMWALAGLPPNTEARRALVSALLRRRDIQVRDFVYYAVEDLRESVPIESERVANRPALRMPEGHPYHVVIRYWKDEVRHFDGAAPTVVLLDDPRLPPGHQGWAYVWSGATGTLISFNERTP